MKLSDVARGRDNNFNLIRFIAAFSVLISHGYAIVLGPTALEPLEGVLGYTLGEVAVDVFFASSGFLVCGSMLRLESIGKFARARALRIYPALLVAVSLTALLLGPLVSTLPVREYLLDPQTYLYVVRNSVLFAGVEHSLPGVFTQLPLAGVVNGSLWTLPFEVWCYAAIAVMWLGSQKIRLARNVLLPLLVLAAVTSLSLFHAARTADLEIAHGFRLFFMFFSGALLQALKEHVSLDWRIATALAAAVLLSAFDSDSFAVVYPPCLAYLVLSLAYMPSRTLRSFNRLGDYSYGIYIYAFPTQQVVLLLYPGGGIGALIMLTAVFTLAAAIGSWHLIEKPFLARKAMPAKPIQTAAGPSADHGKPTSRDRQAHSGENSSSAITSASSRPSRAG